MKKLAVMLLTGVLSLGVIAGCGSGISQDVGEDISVTDSLEETDREPEKEAGESAETEEPQEVQDDSDSTGETDAETDVEEDNTGGYMEGRIGDCMETYFFNFSINSAYLCKEFKGYRPADKKTILVAEATVKNSWHGSITMFDTDFQVQWNSDGAEDYDYPITCYAEPICNEQLPEKYELGVDEEITGLLIFEVPEGRKDFSIAYLELFDDDSEGDVFFVYFTAHESDE